MDANGGWQRRKLGDLIETQKGFAFKSSWYRDTGRPIVKVSDFSDDSVNTRLLTRIPEDIAREYLRYELRTGDVVVQTVGSWPNNPRSVVGKCICVPRSAHRALLNQNAVRLAPLGDLDGRFLYYSLRSPKFRGYIVGTAQGAASQAAITLDAIRAYELKLPPPATQGAIASILSAYDDLNENNLQRMSILEEMAQLIYREWFVHFRFPGHESSDLRPSSGQLPQEWERLSVMQVPAFRFVSENVGPYSGEKEYFATANVNGIDIVEPGIRYSYLEKPSRAQKQPLVNSVWFARMRDTYKVLCFTESSHPLEDACVLSSGFAGFEAPPDWFGFLYCTIKSSEFHEQRDMYATGATQVALTNEGLRRIEITVPDAETAVKFRHAVAPMINQILSLQLRNTILRRMRDLLLPKLISGELDVAELGIDTGGFAA